MSACCFGRADAVTLPGGDELQVSAIINGGASTIKTVDRQWLSSALESRFAECGHQLQLQLVEGDKMIPALKEAASNPDVETIVAGGGDGTISAAAGIIAGTDKALAVLPGGNMNLFARTLGIPLDLDAAITALGHGRRAQADIAYANDRPFIHEFSLGLHPEMIEERDKQKYGSRIGKILGGLRSLSGVLMKPPRIRVRLDDDKGQQRAILTPALAVSNNPFGEGHLPYADSVDSGELGIYILNSVSVGDIASVTARVPFGQWRDMPQMEFFTAREITLNRRRWFKAAVDGELVRMKTPIRIRIEQGGLNVIVPREEHAVRGQ